MYSTYRAPTERSDPDAVTIREIEERLAELNPAWSPDEVRIASVLFAILKQGSSIQKLDWFTRYDRDFLRAQVESLRAQGRLYTGSLSTRFVLDQIPGSEDLIERITGERVVADPAAHRAPAGYDYERHIKPAPLAPQAPPAGDLNQKEKPKVETIENGHAAPAPETCPSEGCGKAKGHMGRCKGTRVGTTLSPSERAKRGAAARRAKAGKKAEQTSKSSARNGRKPARQSVEKPAKVETEIETKVDFFIAYIDNEVEVKLRGDSMAKLRGAMEMVSKIRNGE